MMQLWKDSLVHQVSIFDDIRSIFFTNLRETSASDVVESRNRSRNKA